VQAAVKLSMAIAAMANYGLFWKSAICYELFRQNPFSLWQTMAETIILCPRTPVLHAMCVDVLAVFLRRWGTPGLTVGPGLSHRALGTCQALL